MLTALGGPAGNEKEGLLNLLTYIGQYEDDCKVTRVEAVRYNRLILPTLDNVTARVIQSMCSMNKSQMRQLHSCLKVKFGSSVFSTEYKIA
jgi:hypothetical protein